MNNYYDYQREDEENESDEVDGEPSCSEQRSRVSAQRSAGSGTWSKKLPAIVSILPVSPSFSIRLFVPSMTGGRSNTRTLTPGAARAIITARVP